MSLRDGYKPTQKAVLTRVEKKPNALVKSVPKSADTKPAHDTSVHKSSDSAPVHHTASSHTPAAVSCLCYHFVSDIFVILGFIYLD